MRIRSSKQGGTWMDWDDDLIAQCHKRERGSSYKGVYGRMRWNAPSPTITTQFFNYGSGRFGHPDQDRALTLREGAILQTFPREYEFIRPMEKPLFAKIGRWIGNAVPVRLAEMIGISILNWTAKERFDLNTRK